MRAPRRPALAFFPALAATAVLLGAAGCAPGVPMTIEQPPLTEQNRVVYARLNLQKARALHAEGRFEMAASAARRGLEFEPDNAALHRIRADALEALGEAEKARVHRERADELAPPMKPLAETPHPLAAGANEVLVVLVPPAPELLESTATRTRVPADWPRGVEAATLVDRLRVRLPDTALEVVANSEHPTARSVPAARRWLDEPRRPAGLVSVRVERAFCGRSVKDGDFAVAWLRVGVAQPGVREADVHLIRTVLETAPDEGCQAAAVAVALERVLELDSLHRALGAAPVPAGATWSNTALRTVFPALEQILQDEIQQGRRYFSIGELALALAHFEHARRIDPEDPIANAFLHDTERSIALARLLEPIRDAAREDAADAEDVASAPADRDAGETPPDSDDHLAPLLSPGQRAGLEAQLAHERRRREEMLSALAVLYEMRNAPTPGTVSNMRAGEVSDPTATGVALALPQMPSGSAIEVRTLYAPDGSMLARYYFAEGSEAPVLREEDTDGDAAPDRWIGYRGGVVAEVWESETPGGPPARHLVYGDDGAPVERVELDQDGDGRLDRLFVYAAGLLREESSDTNGDGAFDRFQKFDESGSLTLREEDVDGDDEIDVRTAYRGGRIIRREILNDELLSRIQ